MVRIKPNKELQIEKIKMTCDSRPKHLHKTLGWNHFTYVIGKPGSGKSNFWCNLITKKGRFYWKMYDKIYIFSPSLKTIAKKIRIPEDQQFDSFSMDELQGVIDSEKDEDHHILIILDDVVAQLTRNMPAVLKILYNRRHIGKGLSVIITSQKYNKLPLEMRVAVSHIAMFNSAKRELDDLYNEFSNLERDQFDLVARTALSKPYDFLFVDTTADESSRYFRNFDQICFD
jgi:hypothetical protein